MWRRRRFLLDFPTPKLIAATTATTSTCATVHARLADDTPSSHATAPTLHSTVTDNAPSAESQRHLPRAERVRSAPWRPLRKPSQQLHTHSTITQNVPFIWSVLRPPEILTGPLFQRKRVASWWTVDVQKLIKSLYVLRGWHLQKEWPSAIRRMRAAARVVFRRSCSMHIRSRTSWWGLQQRQKCHDGGSTTYRRPLPHLGCRWRVTIRLHGALREARTFSRCWFSSVAALVPQEPTSTAMWKGVSSAQVLACGLPRKSQDDTELVSRSRSAEDRLPEETLMTRDEHDGVSELAGMLTRNGQSYGPYPCRTTRRFLKYSDENEKRALYDHEFAWSEDSCTGSSLQLPELPRRSLAIRGTTSEKVDQSLATGDHQAHAQRDFVIGGYGGHERNRLNLKPGHLPSYVSWAPCNGTARTTKQARSTNVHVDAGSTRAARGRRSCASFWGTRVVAARSKLGHASVQRPPRVGAEWPGYRQSWQVLRACVRTRTSSHDLLSLILAVSYRSIFLALMWVSSWETGSMRQGVPLRRPPSNTLQGCRRMEIQCDASSALQSRIPTRWSFQVQSHSLLGRTYLPSATAVVGMTSRNDMFSVDGLPAHGSDRAACNLGGWLQTALKILEMVNMKKTGVDMACLVRPAFTSHPSMEHASFGYTLASRSQVAGMDNPCSEGCVHVTYSAAARRGMFIVDRAILRLLTKASVFDGFLLSITALRGAHFWNSALLCEYAGALFSWLFRCSFRMMFLDVFYICS